MDCRDAVAQPREVADTRDKRTDSGRLGAAVDVVLHDVAKGVVFQMPLLALQGEGLLGILGDASSFVVNDLLHVDVFDLEVDDAGCDKKRFQLLGLAKHLHFFLRVLPHLFLN